jgi:hypothetical protein
MSNEQEKPRSNEFIGNDREAWEQYHEQYGPEAYKYRRLYEEVVRQMQNLYEFAEQQDIDLPSPGNSGSL